MWSSVLSGGNELLEAGDDDLEELDRPVEVFQPLRAEILRRAGQLLLLVLEEREGRWRDQDLTAVAGRADAGGAVHRKPQVAVGRERRVTGVDPHPHSDRGPFRPCLFGQRALCSDGCLDGVLRAAERDEERVALRVDLLAARLLEGPAQEPAVRREHVAVGVAQLPEEDRRALDVGEQKGHGAARPLVHRLSLAREGAL